MAGKGVFLKTIATGTRESARVRSLARGVFDIFFPPLCPLCESDLAEEGAGFCYACLDAFGEQLIRGPVCRICGVPFASRQGDDHACGQCLKKKPPFVSARSVYIYGGAVLDAVQRFKYRGRVILAPALGGAMTAAALDLPVTPDVVVPVPLHPGKLKKRGFNQSLLLAKRVAKARSLKLDYLNLKRTCATRPQVELGPGERLKNVAGAFEVANPEAFSKRKVLLIDDVLTTGATVTESSKTLTRAGAEVYILTLARAV